MAAKKPEKRRPREEGRRIQCDWAHLLALAQEADRPLSDEELALWKRGLIDGNSRMWNVEYVHATEKAIDGGDRDQLLAMLHSEIPPPTFLLPMIAHCFSSNAPGRPRALTAFQRLVIRANFDLFTRQLHQPERQVVKQMASSRGVSEKTIRRALDKSSEKDGTKPP